VAWTINRPMDWMYKRTLTEETFDLTRRHQKIG